MNGNLSDFWLQSKSIKFFFGLVWCYLSYSIHFIAVSFDLKLIESTKESFFFNKEFDQIHFSWMYSNLFPKKTNNNFFDFVDSHEIILRLHFNNIIWNSIKVMCCVQCGSAKIIVPPFCSPFWWVLFSSLLRWCSAASHPWMVVPYATPFGLSHLICFFWFFSNKHWSSKYVYGDSETVSRMVFITAQYLPQFIFIFFKWINWNFRSIVFVFFNWMRITLLFLWCNSILIQSIWISFDSVQLNQSEFQVM